MESPFIDEANELQCFQNELARLERGKRLCYEGRGRSFEPGSRRRPLECDRGFRQFGETYVLVEIPPGGYIRGRVPTGNAITASGRTVRRASRSKLLRTRT